MLNKRRACLDLDPVCGGGQRTVGIATFDIAAHQYIAGPVIMKPQGGFSQRRIRRQHRLKGFPRNRKIGLVKRRHRSRIADNRGNRITAIECRSFGKDRLVSKRRNNPKTVPAWNITSVQHRMNTRCCGNKAGFVANHKPRMMMRTADHPHRQRVSRNAVSTVTKGAFNLWLSIKMPNGAANISASHRRYCGGNRAADRQHGIDDFAIAGTAAQHPAKRILNRRPVGRWIGCQQRAGTD